jgi:Transposase DDE domain group 1
LTNLDLPPQELYDQFYVQRGCDSEHRIKELKLGIQADRLSCSSFIANQFRLLLSQAAYILMLRIRQAAEGTQFATAQVERLRSMLIKGAAKVTVSARRVLVELSNYCPFSDEIQQILQQLRYTKEVGLY